MTEYSGSGIMLIEIIDKKPFIILFGHVNIQNIKDYDDLGGIIDNGEKPIESACREAREESCNLINIKPDELTHIMVNTIKVKTYLSHVIIINPIALSDFYHNVKIVHTKCKLSHWKEKTHITRIPLQNLLECKTSYVYDINNEYIYIRSRVIDIIDIGRDFFENIHKYVDKKITLHKHIVNHSDIQCLINTFSYMIYEKKTPITSEKTHDYAVFIIPTEPIENYENMHIEFIGFSHKHPPLKDILKSLSLNRKKWKLNHKNVYKLKNKLYLKSGTLNKSATVFAKQLFRLIKGPIYSSNDYQIKYPCDMKLLKNIEWDYAIIQKTHDGEYKVCDTYPVTHL